MDEIEKAIRNLVAEIFGLCHGAYGAEDGYQGECEREIQKLMAAIKKERDGGE